MPLPRAGAPARRRADRLPVMGLLSACALLRLVMTFHHRVNTDEPQHLHVAWAWTQGLLIYRDVFDNHAPLFSLLLAPLLARVGERPDVVTIMRLAMIPLVVVALWSTWLLARRLHGPAAAWWAVVLAAAWPDFAIGSVEYRADQLWVALWTGALAVGFGGSFTRRRAFAAGLLIGAAFGASMKTSLLLAALTAAALAALALPAEAPGGAGSGARPRPGALAARAGLGLLGVTVVPAAIVAFWAARGGLESLIHGTVRHNLLGGLGLWGAMPWRPLLLVPALPLLAWGAVRIARRAPEPARVTRSATLFLAAGLYWTALEGLWPLVTRQDLLPLVPMMATLVAGALAAREPAGAGRNPRWIAWVFAGTVAIELGVTVAADTPWIDRARLERDELAEVLRLTSPGERVMDLKGEAIFRPRPIYAVFEALTQARLRRGLLRDDIAERLGATRTAVVCWDAGGFPPRARAFMAASYIPVGRWRVAGCLIEPDTLSREDRAFRLGVSQRYALVGARGPATGALDGAPYQGPRWLSAGSHVYRPAPGEGTVAAVWAPAIERGFRPRGLDAGSR